MGIRGADWDHVASGLTFGFHGLHLTTEALAAFGELLLRHGNWRGQQLVPREWVDLATRCHVDTLQSDDGWRTVDWLQGYGYHFWMSRHGYRADGAFGQFCLVIPEHDLVVAMTAAAGDMRAQLEVVWECLLPGLDHRGRPDDDAVLAGRMSELSMPHVTGDHRPGRSAAALVETSSDASALPHGGSVEVRPVDDGWQVTVETQGSRLTIDVGYETWRESTPLGRPVVAMGAWDGDSFVAHIYVITSPHRAHLVVRGERAVMTWNLIPLTGPDLLRHLRSPLVARPDVA
jgi:hypothetical protein